MRLFPRITIFSLGESAAGLLRRRAGRNLEITPASEQVRRGERIQVVLRVDGDAAGESVEAGLVCTETYATFMPSEKLTVSDRKMVDAVAHEQWLPLDSGQTTQTFAFDVPAEAPFSFRGEHLRFTWRVCARQRRRGLDATTGREIEVLP
ncbi:MAG: hypothetical protein ACRDN6_11895 [Gaiellaceae bacterium]